jgi:hypothetical protein
LKGHDGNVRFAAIAAVKGIHDIRLPKQSAQRSLSLSASITGFKLDCLAGDYLNPVVEESVAFAVA